MCLTGRCQRIQDETAPNVTTEQDGVRYKRDMTHRLTISYSLRGLTTSSKSQKRT